MPFSNKTAVNHTAVNKTNANVQRRALLGLRTATPPRAAIDEHCLNTQGIVCDACKESCETRAIVRIRTGNRIAGLTVDTELCNGCGECVNVCPANAIAVTRMGGAA